MEEEIQYSTQEYYTEKDKPCKKKDCPPEDLPLDNNWLMGLIFIFVVLSLTIKSIMNKVKEITGKLTKKKEL
jgi:hypothetical protein